MINLAVSQCLIGDNVRYDGRTKSHEFVLNHLSRIFDLKPICPEVEIGMNVPRNPIQLVFVDEVIDAVEIDDSTKKYSTQLRQHARFIKLGNISGYVFKARSPSCGVGTTAVQGLSELRSGIFADKIMQLHPFLPVVDESVLDDDNYRDQFLENIFCYAAYQAADFAFIRRYGLRWALRTGKSMELLKSVPNSQLESVFFKAMNNFISLKQRHLFLTDCIRSNPMTFSGFEKPIYELINDKSFSIFEKTDQIIKLVVENNTEMTCSTISDDERYLRQQKCH